MDRSSLEKPHKQRLAGMATLLGLQCAGYRSKRVEARNAGLWEMVVRGLKPTFAYNAQIS